MGQVEHGLLVDELRNRLRPISDFVHDRAWDESDELVTEVSSALAEIAATIREKSRT